MVILGDDGSTKEFYEAFSDLLGKLMQGSKMDDYLYHKKGESFH